MDETWLYHYDLEIKQQSMDWRRSGSPGSEIFRVQKSGGKVLASIFWDQDGILRINYLPKGQAIKRSITHLCWCNWRTFWRKYATGSSCSCTTMPLVHRSLATQKKLTFLSFRCLDHAHYSPDLAPSDYHLFPELKKTIVMSPFFILRGGHCCRRDLFGRTNFWFFFEWLEKVTATG